MEELADGLFRPFLKLILWVLRILQFIAWDLMCSLIGWSIGWCFFRLMTFGHFPRERLSELEACSWLKALFIESVGLVLLAGMTFFIVSLI